MKRPYLIAFLATDVVIVLLLYLFLYEPRYQGAVVIAEEPIVFAHRGFGNLAPDNSLAGAKLALAAGLDGVDVDAQLSKDGEIVIFHDVSLERFTNGEGRVDAKTLDELKAYDLGEKYGHGFTNVRIATFDEFVAAIPEDRLLMVELKVPGASDTGIEQKAIDTIAKYDAFDRVYVSSFNPVVLWRLKHIDSRVRTVFIFMDSGWDPARVAATKPEDRVALPWYLQNEVTRRAIRKLVRPDALSINQNVATQTIEKLRSVGYPVFIWPVDTTEEISAALRLEPAAIVSDEPLRAKMLRDAAKN